MAAPKKYKTNTLKTSSSKKSSVRTTTKKRPTSRVGSTKLAKKSFFRPWMALPIIAVVALAGYIIVQSSQAGSYGFYKSCNNLAGGVPFTVGVGGWGSGQTTCTRLVGEASGQVRTSSLSVSEVKNSSKVCAKYYGASQTAQVSLIMNSATIAISNWVSKPSNKGQATTFCANIGNKGRSSDNFVAVKVAKRGKVAVQSIYGTWKVGSGRPVVQDTRPTVANCGKPIGRPNFKWVRAENPRMLIEYKTDLIRTCDAGRHSTGSSWTPWYKTGRTKVNPNYRPPTPSPTASCGGNEVKRGNSCVPKYVYAKAFECRYNWTKVKTSHGNRNKYRCKYKSDGKYDKPKTITCFNSAYYQVEALSGGWRYCARKPGK